MILIKNADVYAPEHLGIKDHRLRQWEKVWKEEAAAGS